MRFTVTDRGDTLTATTNDGRLREVIWTWSGGPYIEYGLDGHADGVLNVYDHKTGSVRIPFTVEAFETYLVDMYRDDENVEAVGQEIAYGS